MDGSLLFHLRQSALNWAMVTATDGETPESVLLRAEAYVQYVLEPLKPDIALAMAEKQALTAVH